jgi:hypothetical protein
VACVVRVSSKGKRTIESLGLNREILCEVRLLHLQRYKALYDVVQLAAQRHHDQEFQDLAKEAQAALRNAALDQAEFAAATRVAIKTKFSRITL